MMAGDNKANTLEATSVAGPRKDPGGGPGYQGSATHLSNILQQRGA